jgi:hypothetical protein
MQEAGRDFKAGQVEATLNYLAAREPRPINYAFEPPPGVPRRSGQLVPQRVTIRDGRQILEKFVARY